MDNADATTGPDLFLGKLPAEIRNQIYDLIAYNEHPLVPYHNRHEREEAGDRHVPGKPNLEPSNFHVLLLNKQIKAEATGLFYHSKEFVMQYDDFCDCWSDERIKLVSDNPKQLKIQNVNFDVACRPKYWERCDTCKSGAVDLLKTLNAKPNLTQVTLVFEDAESFAICLRTVKEELMSLGRFARMRAIEIGRVVISASRTTFELLFPSLLNTYALAADREADALDDDYERDEELETIEDVGHLPEYDQKMYTLIRDILYTGLQEEETTEKLQLVMRKLALAASFNRKDVIDFTIGIVECAADMIDEDESPQMIDRNDLVELWPSRYDD